MNKLLIGMSALVALAANPVMAADAPVKAPRAPAAAFSWTGFYSGSHAGYGWGDTSWTFPVANFYSPAGAAFDTEPRGGIFGSHIGYNIQINPQFVLGIEGSYAWTRINDRVTGFVPTFPADTFHTLVKDLASVTGRLGFVVWSNSMLYAKGGWATAEVQLDAVSGPPVTGAQLFVKDRLNGWTVGGGLEWMMSPQWVVGLEFNHYRLEGATYDLLTFGTVVGSPVRVVLDDITINAVTGRISYKWGAPPVSARY